MAATLADIFFELARAGLAGYPQLAHEWTSGPRGKRTLRIPKADSSGFDVTIECEPNGLYLQAGDWHGAPWDANTPGFSDTQVAEQCMGFVRTLLSSDASLTVRYAGGRPYKWLLRYPTEGAPVLEEMGLLFYNYFGRRETREFRNRHLPPRY
jgi:hypothetical protein